MTRIDRYVLHQLLGRATTFLLGLIVLYTGFTASVAIAAVLAGELSADQFWLYLLARNMIALEVLLPTAFFLGTVLAALQFHREREALALYASGISPLRLQLVVGFIGVALGLLVALLTVFGRPWSYQVNDRLRNASEYNLEQLQPGEFYALGQDMVIHHKQAGTDGESKSDVFVWRLYDGATEVLEARSARSFEDDHRHQWLQLDDGTQYRLGSPDGDRAVEFRRLFYRLVGFARGATVTRANARATAELAFATNPKHVAEFQWRTCLPLIALLLPTIGFRIGTQPPGASGYRRVWLALGVYVVIYAGFSALRTGVENDQIAALPGMYAMPLAILGVYGLVCALVRR